MSKTKQKDMKNSCDEKDSLIAKYEAYIDNLNDDKACLVDQIEQRDAEIKMLNGLLVKAVSDAEQERFQCKNLCEPTYKYLLETARNEAIDELANRIATAIYPEHTLSVCQVYRIAQETKEKFV